MNDERVQGNSIFRFHSENLLLRAERGPTSRRLMLERLERAIRVQIDEWKTGKRIENCFSGHLSS